MRGYSALLCFPVYCSKLSNLLLVVMEGGVYAKCESMVVRTSVPEKFPTDDRARKNRPEYHDKEIHDGD